MHHDDVAIVIIGRNEGERLRRCIETVLPQADREAVVYADSGSTDGSPDLARGFGVHVLELDSSRPFSAARGRNEGLNALRNLRKERRFVQFVDGDCALHPEWVARAREAMANRPELAAICGILRERERDRSIYNRLCEMEWNSAFGEIDTCGGIAMMRASALAGVGGFRAEMMAGEEPELCARLRAADWKIVRINAEMGVHDAEMTRMVQWWRRTARGGHAWAERAWLHGRGSDRASARQVASIIFWSMALPAIIILTLWPTSGWSALLALAYPIQWLRMWLARLRAGYRLGDASLDAFFTMIGKFAEAVGVLRYARSLLLRRSPSISYERPQSKRTVPVASSASGETS